MSSYFVTNFPIFCICIAMGIVSFSHFKTNKKNSIYVFAILSLCLILSVTVYLDIYADQHANILLGTWMTYLGYVIRPVCIYFFIRMADRDRLLPTWIFYATMGLNALLYAPALFVGMEFAKVAYQYIVSGDTPAELLMVRGPLNYSSHILSALYLAYTIFISFRLISMKHRDDALVVLICAAFVVTAVVLEATQLAVNLLNFIIAISCVFYFFFVNRDVDRRDALTQLYNRKTYYEDVARNMARVAGVILFDMNGLKQLNDNQGHEEGDKAIRAISQAVLCSLLKDMSAYRMGGDEFLILSLHSGEKELLHVAQDIQKKVDEAGYSVSFGIAYHQEKEDVDTLVKRAEIEMYKDKSEYYRTHHIERRRR